MSACLLGQEVRYDGRHKLAPLLVEIWSRHLELVPVCPEMELGLGVPREPIELRARGDGAVRLVGVDSARDLTEAMLRLSRKRVRGLAQLGLDGYVFKSDSPSCGLRRVPVRVEASRNRPVRRGHGLFAGALCRQLPLLPVEESEQLEDERIREQFVAQICAHHRLRQRLSTGWTRDELRAFHRSEELALRARDPGGYRRLGALLTPGAGLSRAALASAYARGFMAVMRRPVTPRRHGQVLGWLVESLAPALPARSRRQLTQAVAACARGSTPWHVPATLAGDEVRHHALARWIDQSYLRPEPLQRLLTARS